MSNEICIDSNITSDILNTFLEQFPTEELVGSIFILEGFGVKLTLLDLFDNYDISTKIKHDVARYHQQKEEESAKKKFMDEIISNIVEDDQMF